LACVVLILSGSTSTSTPLDLSVFSLIAQRFRSYGLYYRLLRREALGHRLRVRSNITLFGVVACTRYSTDSSSLYV